MGPQYCAAGFKPPQADKPVERGMDSQQCADGPEWTMRPHRVLQSCELMLSDAAMSCLALSRMIVSELLPRIRGQVGWS
jgi:hypothetical protein